MTFPRLLITRPADEARRTAEAAQAAGFRPVEAPLLAIEQVDAVLPAGRPDAIIFTSPRAPQGLVGITPDLRDCPVYTVGARTTEAAIRAGFAIAGEGQADGNAALQLAAAAGHRVILHPRGEDHIALSVPEGVRLQGLEVYRARAVSTLSVEIVNQLESGEIFATLLLSPRTGRVFADLVQQAGLDLSALRLIALSAQVAEAAGPGWNAVEVADAPRLDEAFAAARRLWQGVGHA